MLEESKTKQPVVEVDRFQALYDELLKRTGGKIVVERLKAFLAATV